MTTVVGVEGRREGEEGEEGEDDKGREEEREAEVEKLMLTMTLNAHGAVIQSEIEISQTRGEVLSVEGPAMKLPEAVSVHDGSDILMRGFDYKEVLKADCTEIEVTIEKYHKCFSIVSSIPTHLPRGTPETIRSQRLFVCGYPLATISSCFFSPRKLPQRVFLRIVADRQLHPTILCQPGEKLYEGPLSEGKHVAFFSIMKEQLSNGLRVAAGKDETIRDFVRAYPQFALAIPDDFCVGDEVVNIAAVRETLHVSGGPDNLTANGAVGEDNDEGGGGGGEDDDDDDDDIGDSDGSDGGSLYVPSSFFGFLPGSASNR
eukprot:753605-Hanusia_phi.AAC.8